MADTKKPGEMTSEEWAAVKESNKGKTFDEIKKPEDSEEDAKAEAEAKAKEEAEAAAAKEAEEAAKKEEEEKARREEEDRKAKELEGVEGVEDESPYVPLSKFMDLKNKHKELEAINKRIAEELESAKKNLPASERDRAMKQELESISKEFGGVSVPFLERLAKVLQSSVGVSAEAVQRFEQTQREQAQREAAAKAQAERTKRVSREIESEEFKKLLDRDGITDPKIVSELKKGILHEALALPDGVPLARVWRSSELRDKALEGNRPPQKTGEKSRGGSQGASQEKKKPSEMSSAEWEAYKKENADEGMDVIRTLPSGNIKKIRING